MRARTVKYIAGVAALALAIPVVAQQAPESLLPPGFGDSPPARDATPARTPAPSGTTAPPPSTALVQPIPLDAAAPEVASNAVADVPELSEEELAAQQAKYDLPDTARRTLDRIGPLTPETGGVNPEAFGGMSGRFLSTLMKVSRAPFADRSSVIRGCPSGCAIRTVPVSTPCVRPTRNGSTVSTP